MNLELGLSVAAALLSAASLAVALLRRRKPSLAAAALRGVHYAKGLGGDRETQIRNACLAVIREDAGDNGRRDWPDQRIRQEVQGLIP